MKPIPTTRFVIDPLRVCNIKCKFCYHLHTYPTWKDYTWPIEDVYKAIDDGIARGNDYVDITGGEPTLYPDIEKVIDYGLSTGVKTCLITNGTVNEKKANSIMDAGVDDWLVSRQGLEETHDFVTNNPGGFQKQIKFLNNVANKMDFRFNCVLHNFNQEEVLEIAREMAKYEPTHVNFINMNPHNQWLHKTLETKEVIADLSIVQPLLEQAIDLLESAGTTVNVRYYPMCCLAEKYRKTVCNDLHVVFDPYEWDYCIEKNYEAFRNWGINTSKNVEHKERPCSVCGLQWICGGVNKAYFKASEGRYIEPVAFAGDKNDFYYYRQHNG